MTITRKSIEKALDIALLTMDRDEQGVSVELVA